MLRKMGLYEAIYLRHLDGDMTAAATNIDDSPFETGPGVVVPQFDDVIGHCVPISIVIYLVLQIHAKLNRRTNFFSIQPLPGQSDLNSQDTLRSTRRWVPRSGHRRDNARCQTAMDAP